MCASLCLMRENEDGRLYSSKRIENGGIFKNEHEKKMKKWKPKKRSCKQLVSTFKNSASSVKKNQFILYSTNTINNESYKLQMIYREENPQNWKYLFVIIYQGIWNQLAVLHWSNILNGLTDL